MSRYERDFEADFVADLEDVFPGCLIIKGASMFRQGIPDRIMFFEDFYAFFELKRTAKSRAQPNQPYYVDLFNDWSFAAFVYPENKDEVLDAVLSAYRARRKTRSAQR